MKYLLRISIIISIYIYNAGHLKSQFSCYEGFIEQASHAQKENNIQEAIISYQGIILRCPSSTSEQKKYALQMIENVFASNKDSLEKINTTLEKAIIEVRNAAAKSNTLSIQREIETIKTKALSNSFNSLNENNPDDKLTLAYYSKTWLDQINSPTLHNEQVFAQAIYHKYSSDTTAINEDQQTNTLDTSIVNNIRIMERLSGISNDFERLNNNQINIYTKTEQFVNKITTPSYIYDMDIDNESGILYFVTRQGSLYKVNLKSAKTDSIKISDFPLFNVKVNKQNANYLVNVGYKHLELFDDKINKKIVIETTLKLVDFHYLYNKDQVLIADNKNIYEYSFDGDKIDQKEFAKEIKHIVIDNLEKYRLLSFHDNSVALYNSKNELLVSIENSETIESISFEEDNSHFHINFQNNYFLKYPTPDSFYAELLTIKPALSTKLKDKYFIEDIVLSDELKTYLQKANN